MASGLPKITLASRFRYAIQKLDYALTLTLVGYARSEIKGLGVVSALWKSLFKEKMTFIEKCADPNNSQTVLFRQLATLNGRRKVAMNDVVIYMDPERENEYPDRVKHCLIGRVAGVEGDEFASSNEKDEPIVLDAFHCWILAGDSEKVVDYGGAQLKDSLTYGPIHISSIIGRPIFIIRDEERGFVNNSDTSMEKDLPVVQVELDMDEMTKVHQS